MLPNLRSLSCPGTASGTQLMLFFFWVEGQVLPFLQPHSPPSSTTLPEALPLRRLAPAGGGGDKDAARLFVSRLIIPRARSCPTFFVRTRKAGQAQCTGRGCGAHSWPSKQLEGSRSHAFTDWKRWGSESERLLLEQTKPMMKKVAETHEIPRLAVPEQLTPSLWGRTGEAPAPVQLGAGPRARGSSPQVLQGRCKVAVCSQGAARRALPPARRLLRAARLKSQQNLTFLSGKGAAAAGRQGLKAAPPAPCEHCPDLGVPAEHTQLPRICRAPAPHGRAQRASRGASYLHLGLPAPALPSVSTGKKSPACSQHGNGELA